MGEFIAKAGIMVIFFALTFLPAGRGGSAHGRGTGMKETKPNRLISEKSPYLLQHARNPVDWYPWGEAAFIKARAEDKPIFLSIGYSTCHWCHVMEHESFEDREVAKLMNETFVSIKVDREERPDLDQIYMTVCQMLTGNGGWPLTIVVTPDKKPFFAATYLPKESRFGRTGMMELIPRIKMVWGTRREEVLNSADQIIAALQSTTDGGAGGDLGVDVLEKAYQELLDRHDRVYGGFSEAPKFPTPHNFFFLLRYWKRTGNKQALEMVEKTLEAMRLGGIYDQIGYGFHRYSTDREWLVPHFEKMLYDQAMLAMAYLEAYQATGKVTYAETAREIFTYVLRDMTGPEGAFYSAEDADSEGEEGKFYVWEEKEIRRSLKEKADSFIRAFNVEEGGNFKEEATGERPGTNILHLRKPISELAADLPTSEKKLKDRLASARQKLFEAREKRIHPFKDDKVLTDWNGLMIVALSKGARVLGEKKYAASAQRAVDFILSRMRNNNGRLLHRYRGGEAGIGGHLDDYAFLVWGLIELYQAQYEPAHLRIAIQLTEEMIGHFWDGERGGFFFTPDDGERLIVRKKEAYDGAVPSGNSVAMYNLLRLARLTGRSDLEEKAASVGRAFSEQIGQYASGYTQFLVAADFGIGPSYEVVVAGPRDAKDTEDMLKAVNRPFLPNKVVLFRDSSLKSPPIDEIARFAKNQVSIDGKATGYVCVGNACKAPTTQPRELLEQMQ